MFCVADAFVLGDLKCNEIERKADAAGGSQCRLYAGFRLIDGIGQEIDAQFSVKPKSSGLLNRFDPVT
jgi:hypothetical protein